MKKGNLSGEIAAIGSLPFEDSSKAIEFVFKYLKNFPHWPQLPKLGEKEDFISQYISNLVGRDFLYKNEKGYLRARTAADDIDFTEKLTDFMELTLELEEGDDSLLAEFAFPRENAEGFYEFVDVLKSSDSLDFDFIKGQVSGPLSLGLEIKDEEGRSVFFDPQWQEIISMNLANKARWQTKELNKFDKNTVIFFDDPGLTAYGKSSYVALDREDIVRCFERIVRAVQFEDALAGIHVCAGADLSIPLDAGINILNFDTYEYFNSVLPYTEKLNKFLSNGGYLAWGIVPSDDRIFEESTDTLMKKLKEKMDKLNEMGVSLELVKKQSFITPACGLGSRSEEVTIKVYEILNEIYNRGFNF